MLFTTFGVLLAPLPPPPPSLLASKPTHTASAAAAGLAASKLAGFFLRCSFSSSTSSGRWFPPGFEQCCSRVVFLFGVVFSLSTPVFAAAAALDTF